MSMASEFTAEALREVEQRTGVPMLWIATPAYLVQGDPTTWKPAVDEAKRLGAAFCLPHQCVTDPLLDRVNNAQQTGAG